MMYLLLVKNELNLNVWVDMTICHHSLSTDPKHAVNILRQNTIPIKNLNFTNRICNEYVNCIIIPYHILRKFKKHKCRTSCTHQSKAFNQRHSTLHLQLQ